MKDKSYTRRFGAQSQQVDLHKAARLLKGDIYLISDEGEDTVCGCFSIRLLWNDDIYLTSFYVEEMYYPYARNLVERIIKEHNLTRAFVTTCDEAFLSICMDLHKKISISGCWYYNRLSKKTITSAGRYSKTRLLNISF